MPTVTGHPPPSSAWDQLNRLTLTSPLSHFDMRYIMSPATSLARAIGVTPARVNEIVRRRRGITAETALRLAKYFNTDAQSWMNLQTRYELALAERTARAALQAIRPRKVA